MDNDYMLALQLQAEFDQENRSVAIQDESGPEDRTAITDPDWEKYDPNPDIHNLFRLFDAKFFWNTLGSVEVRWSNRMYMCAGICYYKGRGGCSIGLSLPLLKFRPRKDLVETLLHEMIHAYLFLTKNNRDRTGHGPEFQKHMYRINKTAGTKITIYHAFHDEVNFYKTHVWRCNGKCRADPPYFGMLRRAMNRAPGPNDFWFAQHQKQCGGSFEKISEPEGFKSGGKKNSSGSGKSKASKKSTKPGNQPELNKFFTPTKLNTSSSPTSTDDKKSKSIKKGGKQTDLTNFLVPKNEETPSNQLHSLKNLTDPKGKVVNFGGKTNQVHGFTGLTNAKGSRTFVVNPKRGQVETKNEPSHSASTFVPFGGEGHTLGGGTIDKYKSRLLLSGSDSESTSQSSFTSNPQDASCSSKPLVHSNSSPGGQPEIIDLSDEECSDSPASSDEPHVNCPACSLLVPTSEINSHLDDCTTIDELFKATNDISAENSDSEDDYSGFADKNPSPMEEESDSTVACPKCNQSCIDSQINEHLDVCLAMDE